MTPLGWIVALGLVAFPILFGHAYLDYRRGDRTRQAFVRSYGIGAVGFAMLLQQAAERWLTTPADDAVAVLSFVVLVGGIYAIYRGYTRGDGKDSDECGGSAGSDG
jgi:hypothetical protein